VYCCLNNFSFPLEDKTVSVKERFLFYRKGAKKNFISFAVVGIALKFWSDIVQNSSAYQQPG
jgi:hypothetical protein